MRLNQVANLRLKATVCRSIDSHDPHRDKQAYVYIIFECAQCLGMKQGYYRLKFSLSCKIQIEIKKGKINI